MPPRVQCPKCATLGDRNAVRTFVFSQAGQCDQCGACAMWTCRRCNAHFCPLCFPLPQSARSVDTSTRSDRASVDAHPHTADAEGPPHTSDRDSNPAPDQQQQHFNITNARAHGRAEDTQAHDAEGRRPHARDSGQQQRIQVSDGAQKDHYPQSHGSGSKNILNNGVYVHQPHEDAYYQQLPSRNVNNGPHSLLENRHHRRGIFLQHPQVNVEHLYRQPAPVTWSKSEGVLRTGGAAHSPAQTYERHAPGWPGADSGQNAGGNQGGANSTIPPPHQEIPARSHLQYHGPESVPVHGNNQNHMGEYGQSVNHHENARPEQYRGEQQQPQQQQQRRQRARQEQQQQQGREREQQQQYEHEMTSHFNDNHRGSTVEQPLVVARTTPRGMVGASTSLRPPRASTHLQTAGLTTPSDMASTPAGHWERNPTSPRDAMAAPSGRRGESTLKRRGVLNLTDRGSPRELFETTPQCHFHREPMNYFCFQCSKESVTFCCADCIALGPHLGHDAIKLSQAVARARDTAIEHLANLRSKMAEAASKYKLVRTREHEASQLCDAATCQIDVRVAELKMRLDEMSSSLSKRCREIFTKFGETNSKDERVFKSEKRRLELESSEWEEVGECLKGDMRNGLEVFSHAYSKSTTKDVPSLKGSDALEELDMNLGSVLQRALGLDVRPPCDDETVSLRARAQKLQEQLLEAHNSTTAEHDMLRARVQELEQEGETLRRSTAKDTERSAMEWQRACAERGWIFRRCAHDEYLIGPPTNLQKVRVAIETVVRGRVGGKTMSLSQCMEMLARCQSIPTQRILQQHRELRDDEQRTNMNQHDTPPHQEHHRPDMHFAKDGAGGGLCPLPRNETGLHFTERRADVGVQQLSLRGNILSADVRDGVAEGRNRTPTRSSQKTPPRRQFTEPQYTIPLPSNSNNYADKENDCGYDGPQTPPEVNDHGHSYSWQGSQGNEATEDVVHYSDARGTQRMVAHDRRGDFHDRQHKSTGSTAVPALQNLHNDMHTWRESGRTMTDTRNDGEHGAEKTDDVVEQDDVSNASVQERLRMLNKKLRMQQVSEPVEGESLGVSGGRNGAERRWSLHDNGGGAEQAQPQQQQQQRERQRQQVERLSQHLTYAEHVVEKKKNKQVAKSAYKGRRYRKENGRAAVMTTAEGERVLSADKREWETPTHIAAKERPEGEWALSADTHEWESPKHDAAKERPEDEWVFSADTPKWETPNHDAARHHPNDTDTTRSEGSVPENAHSRSTTTTDKDSVRCRVLDLKEDNERAAFLARGKCDERHEDELFRYGSGMSSENEQDDGCYAVSHNDRAQISEKWDELLNAYPQYEKLLLQKQEHGRAAYFFGQHELDLRLKKGVLSVTVGNDVISAAQFLTRFGGFQNARQQEDGAEESNSKRNGREERQRKRSGASSRSPRETNDLQRSREERQRKQSGESSRSPRETNDLQRSEKKLPNTSTRSPRERNGYNGGANNHSAISGRSSWPRRDII